MRSSGADATHCLPTTGSRGPWPISHCISASCSPCRCPDPSPPRSRFTRSTTPGSMRCSRMIPRACAITAGLASRRHGTLVGPRAFSPQPRSRTRRRRAAGHPQDDLHLGQHVAPRGVCLSAESLEAVARSLADATARFGGRAAPVPVATRDAARERCRVVCAVAARVRPASSPPSRDRHELRCARCPRDCSAASRRRRRAA